MKYIISIPAGTQPNSEIVHPGHGFYDRKKHKNGNFIVIVIIEIPEITDMNEIKSLMDINSSYYQ
jgi:DnaJ-class molecular chaperone